MTHYIFTVSPIDDQLAREHVVPVDRLKGDYFFMGRINIDGHLFKPYDTLTVVDCEHKISQSELFNLGCYASGRATIYYTDDIHDLQQNIIFPREITPECQRPRILI